MYPPAPPEDTRSLTEAIAELHAAPAFRHPSVRRPAKPTERDLRNAADHLIAELERSETIRELSWPSVESYLATWRRVHEDLGNGVKDPGRGLSAAYQIARVT